MKKLFSAIFLCFALVSSLVQTTQSRAADLPNFTPIARGALANDSVYFVMTDRFFNVDTSNDEAGLTGFPAVTGYDPADYGYFHGGDLKGLTEKLDYIQGLGFNSIWITPPVKQKYVQGDSAAYHGYWGLDFTTIDPHLGTEADFKNFVTEAHKRNIKVIVDIVVNHTADVIKYRGDVYSYSSMSEYPYKDCNGKKFDPAKYAGKANFPKLCANKSFPVPPIVSDKNKNIKAPAFLNDLTNYHNRGDSTFSGESSTFGDFFGLDDVFTEKPAVVAGWTKVWQDWITRFDIDGYRIDTAKHVNPEFWQAFIPAVLKTAKAAGKSYFPIYGEVWDTDPNYTAKFVTDYKFPGILDFAFQAAASKYATYGNGELDFVDIFNQDDLYTTATTSAYGLTTFLDNHDMGRIGMFIAGSANGDQQVILAKSKLANALLFLLRGGPALYYGDEKGLAGSGGDAQARQDMFATAVTYWQDENRVGSDPIGTKSSFDVKNPLEDQISQMQAVIVKNPALRSGTQQIRFANGSLFAVTRYLKGQEYVVAYNAGAKQAEAKFKVSTSGSKWQLILGNSSAASFTKNTAAVTLPAYSYAAYKAASPLKAKAAPSIKLNAPRSDYALDYLLEISATVPGDEYNQVTFLMRESGKNWVNLGTSDRRTIKSSVADDGLYRVYIEPRKFPSGTNLEFVSVVKTESGKSATSKIVKFKINY